MPPLTQDELEALYALDAVMPPSDGRREGGGAPTRARTSPMTRELAELADALAPPDPVVIPPAQAGMGARATTGQNANTSLGVAEAQGSLSGATRTVVSLQQAVETAVGRTSTPSTNVVVVVNAQSDPAMNSAVVKIYCMLQSIRVLKLTATMPAVADSAGHDFQLNGIGAEWFEVTITPAAPTAGKTIVVLLGYGIEADAPVVIPPVVLAGQVTGPAGATVISAALVGDTTGPYLANVTTRAHVTRAGTILGLANAFEWLVGAQPQAAIDALGNAWFALATGVTNNQGAFIGQGGPSGNGTVLLLDRAQTPVYGGAAGNTEYSLNGFTTAGNSETRLNVVANVTAFIRHCVNGLQKAVMDKTGTWTFGGNAGLADHLWASNLASVSLTYNTDGSVAAGGPFQIKGQDANGAGPSAGGSVQVLTGAAIGAAARGPLQLGLGNGNTLGLELTEPVVGQRVLALAGFGVAVTNVQLPANTGDKIAWLGPANTLPTVAPTAGLTLWTDAATGLHAGPPHATNFLDFGLVPLLSGAVNSQTNKRRVRYAVVRTTDAVATLILQLVIPPNSVVAGDYNVLARSVTGTVGDGWARRIIVGWKNVGGVVTAFSTTSSAGAGGPIFDASMATCGASLTATGGVTVVGLAGVTIDWQIFWTDMAN